MADVTRRLVGSYREVVWEKRGDPASLVPQSGGRLDACRATGGNHDGDDCRRDQNR